MAPMVLSAGINKSWSRPSTDTNPNPFTLPENIPASTDASGMLYFPLFDSVSLPSATSTSNTSFSSSRCSFGTSNSMASSFSFMGTYMGSFMAANKCSFLSLIKSSIPPLPFFQSSRSGFSPCPPHGVHAAKLRISLPIPAHKKEKSTLSPRVPYPTVNSHSP